jgi:hypothetical protein
MTSINVDFSDVEGGFEVLPAGEYPIVITKVVLRDSQKSEYPYLNYTLEVTETPDGVEADAEGRLLWFTSSFHPKALWRMKEVFENLGIFEENIQFEVEEDGDERIVVKPALVGLPAKAVVKVKDYQGNDKNDVETLIAINPQTSPRKTAEGEKAQTRAGGKAFK